MCFESETSFLQNDEELFVMDFCRDHFPDSIIWVLSTK